MAPPGRRLARHPYGTGYPLRRLVRQPTRTRESLICSTRGGQSARFPFLLVPPPWGAVLDRLPSCVLARGSFAVVDKRGIGARGPRPATASSTTPPEPECSPGPPPAHLPS